MLATCSVGQVTKVGSGYLMRSSYTKGQVIRFEIVSRSKMLPAPNIVRMKWTVLSVMNGTARIQVQVEGLGANTPKPFEIVIDRQNQAVGGSAFGAAYPSGPIKPGTSWKAALPLNLGAVNPGGGKEVAKYTFDGVKTVRGKQYAALTIRIDGIASGEGTELISVSDGILFSNEMLMTISAGNQVVSVSSSLSRKQ